jgi:teichuronic acid biosynthesis protein TuaE
MRMPQMKFKSQAKVSIAYLAVNFILVAIFTMLSRTSIVPLLFSAIAFVCIYRITRDDFNLVQLCTILTFALINSQIKWNSPAGLLYYYYIPTGAYFVYALVKVIRDHTRLPESLSGILSGRLLAVLSVVLALYVVLCVVLSRNKSAMFNIFKYHMIMIFLFCIFFYAMLSGRKRKVLFSVSRLLLAGLLLLGFLEFLKIDLHMGNKISDTMKTMYLPETYLRIPSVFFYNQNNYAVVLLFSLVLLVPDLAFGKGRGRAWADVVLILLTLLQFIVIMSRISVYAFYALLFVGVVLLAVKAARHRGEPRKVFLRFAACAAVSVLVLNGATLALKQTGAIPQTTKIDELTNDTDISTGETVNSVNVRLQLIENVVQGVVTERNYLGFGPGNTLEYLKTCKNSDLTQGIFNVHSAWIELLGDYGIPAFLAMMLFFTWRFLASFMGFIKRDRYRHPFMLLLLIPAIFVSAFMPSSVVNFPSFTILFAAIMGASFLAKPDKAEEK